MKLLFPLAAAALFCAATAANAAIIDVVGGNSSLGTAAAKIAAPADVRDDAATNTGQQGFDEKQNVLLGADLAVDGDTIAAGTRVDSHMIFLNTEGDTLAEHFRVLWTFSGTILGVMSNVNGSLEANSSAILGAMGTTYSGILANRGLENTGCNMTDGYSVAGATLCLTMRVTEPGDWIRVVTAATPVPLPAGLPLLLAGLGGIGLLRARKGAKTA